MKQIILILATASLAVIAIALVLAPVNAADITRPEEIKSMRQVIYDTETYAKLADQWRAYYGAYPSEYAYANWMYAARYAGDKDYVELLNEGYKKYPANPTILYLKGMEKHGKHENREGRRYLEQACTLDPDYSDPWFSLIIHYMDDGDQERIDLALRHILESGVISEEIMDYCYNMLVSLDQNAILISNGDNDTYPVWILTRILKVRPDVMVANRSLLNTDWYPLYLIDRGLPSFIGKRELEDLRNAVIARIKDKQIGTPPAGPFGDTLIFKIIESAERSGRPVYFAATLFITESLKKIAEKGRDLGLVTLVTPSNVSYAKQLRQTYRTWLDSFRTNGLDSWRIANLPKTSAGVQLVSNYAFALAATLDSLKSYAPETRGELFNWYLKHIDRLLKEETRDSIQSAWCHQSDIEKIKKWCDQKGIYR